MRLESFIRDGFLNKQEVVSIFFDMEKAYDTTWKYGILNDLHEAGLRGRMPVFISKFLENRNFRVRRGSTLSDPFEQEMGVPQGIILSVTLFSLKINSLTKVLSKDVEGSLYVDDFLMSYRAKTTKACELQLQGCLSDLLSKFGEISFQEYVTEGISHPVFYGDLVYKLRRIRCEANFVPSGSKIVKRLRRRKYDPLIIENTIGLVLGPSTALYRSFLEPCTLTNKAVGTI